MSVYAACSVPSSDAAWQLARKSASLSHWAPLIVVRLHICQPDRRVPTATSSWP